MRVIVAWLVLFLISGCFPAGSTSVAPVPPVEEPPLDPPPAAVTVTVENGSGDGEYEPGEQIEVAAEDAPGGMVFDRWTGDVDALDDPDDPTTMLTVPEGGAAVTAVYRALPPPPPPSGAVTASVETDPVHSDGDAADDSCIWIHPTDTSQSTVIGTDKTSHELLVYDLDGNEIHRYDAERVNNVDVRYGFPFDGDEVDLVAASNRTQDAISVYRVDRSTRGLVHLGDIATGNRVYGFCLYKSDVNGDFYGIVTSKSGDTEQWRIFDDGNSGVDGTLARSFDVGGRTEGCVADDELGHLYIAEEGDGIWKYGAEPDEGSSREMVDGTGSSGELTGDVEGLTIYYGSNGDGYLIASSQGASEFVVYERAGDNAHVLTFEIEAGALDRVTGTDGIDVTNVNLGGGFTQGFFVAQDGSNSGNQNFKLVPWERIAFAADNPLLIDTGWDPRR